MTRRLLLDPSGASATEFALVLPLLLLFLFGIIDAGRWMWTYNRAEKATQMGARMAVVVAPVSAAVGGTYIGACSPPLTQGDPIPANCFATITCRNDTCTGGSFNSTPFNQIVTRMQKFMPELTAANIAIQYTPSGLGYAGNPYGADISPLVTVKIGAPATALQFTPITSFLLTSITMPSFTTSLTAEDMSGGQSN